MGVTLERVQNKFACIIGELCSEPLILSQFAIWVDLRIAEYKAKGAISLECTGDEPDPSWLKGHKSESPESPPERGTTTEEVPGWNPKGSIPTETLEERLSPVVVKEEPLHIDEADVFPLSLHRATPQKRRSCDSVVSEGRDFASPSRPPFKQRRTLPPLASATQSDSSDNQTESLMSIIQGKSSESVEGVTSDSQGAVEISLIDDNSDDYSELMNDTNSNITSMLISPSTSLPSSDATNEDSYIPVMDPYLYPASFPLRLSASCIKNRMSNLQDLPQQSVLDIVKAVGTLERWLWAKFNEKRPIDEISAEELDSYLVQFYPILRRKNGAAYLTGSYQKNRSSLDRYLKNMGYSYSIADPTHFPQSQQMYYVGLQRTRKLPGRRRKNKRVNKSNPL